MIHIVLNAVKMLNFFPTKGGISDTKPKDHHVWRDSPLQETLESASWTILSKSKN
jgi:predicted KAP-like P-loop ATPase